MTQPDLLQRGWICSVLLFATIMGMALTLFGPDNARTRSGFSGLRGYSAEAGHPHRRQQEFSHQKED
jgi:hypothetical protein